MDHALGSFNLVRMLHFIKFCHATRAAVQSVRPMRQLTNSIRYLFLSLVLDAIGLSEHAENCG